MGNSLLLDGKNVKKTLFLLKKTFFLKIFAEMLDYIKKK